MSKGEKRKATGATSGERWWFDRPYFWMALLQVKLYEEAEAGLEPHERPLVQITYAAASIVMLVAAMEAHANYLLAGELPERTGLSVSQCKKLTEPMKLRDKWLFACEVLAGKLLLHPGRPPFQTFSKAVSLRNNFGAHAKLEEREAHWQDAKDVNIGNAKAAIQAARDILGVVYGGMGRDAPSWARSEVGKLTPRRDIFVRGSINATSTVRGVATVKGKAHDT